MDEDLADLNIDDLENSGGSNDDEEIQLTSSQVLEMMEEAWINERFAPEILPNKLEIVECLLEQISHMETNLEQLEATDFKKTIHQLEIDRIKFLVSSYLRKRLEKIEACVYHVLSQEEERAEKQQNLYLTEAESEFAKTFRQDLDNHLKGAVSFYPGLPLDEWRNQPVKPNMHSFVFVKSKKEVEGVVIDDGRAGEEGDLVDLNTGSQLIISYNSIQALVKNGNVNLI